MKLKFLTLILLGFFSLISSTNAKSYYMDIADTYAYNHGGLYVMRCDITPMTEDIQNSDTGQPMHHYMEVDFATINYSGPGGPND